MPRSIVVSSHQEMRRLWRYFATDHEFLTLEDVLADIEGDEDSSGYRDSVTESVQVTKTDRGQTDRGRQVGTIFPDYHTARHAGYLSTTRWKKRDRVVKPDAVPSIVVQEQIRSTTVEPWQVKITGEPGNYLVAHDYWEVFSLDQTVAEPQRNQSPGSASENESSDSGSELKATPLACESVPTEAQARTEKRLSLYVPRNLECDDDYLAYFLNLLHWRRLHYQANERGFIPLKTEYLRKVIPDWPSRRDEWISRGIIECDWTYIEGRKCFGYRKSAKYRTKTRKISCSNIGLRKRVSKTRVTLQPVHEWLSNHFSLLDFDIELARRIIPRLEQRQQAISREQYEADMIERAEHCHAGDYETSVCRFGRFHSMLTTLHSGLRPCLNIDGINLAGVDLANSQPLIAGICALRFYDNRDSRHSLLKKSFTEDVVHYSDRELRHLEQVADRILSESENNQYIQKTNSNKLPTPHPPPSPLYDVKTSQELTQVSSHTRSYADDQTSTLVDYLKVCESGTLYQSLMLPGEDKREFKTRFFKDVFFGKNSAKSKLKTRFKKRYPAIADMLHTIKTRDYRLSSYLLQHYESTIFISMICGRLMREYPDNPVFTIHDSILCLSDHLLTVKSIIREEFSRFGVAPTLREESYSPDELTDDVSDDPGR